MDKNTKNTDMQVSVNLDTTPILYTDTIFMNINADGVMLDVCQKLGPSQSLRIVSRVGMSREHAERFVKEMSKLLAMTQGRKQTGD